MIISDKMTKSKDFTNNMVSFCLFLEGTGLGGPWNCTNKRQLWKERWGKYLLNCHISKLTNKMIHHMFVFGVVIPTVITIALFLGFLFCWFKFNIREKLFGKDTTKKNQSLKRVRGPIIMAEDSIQYTSDSELCGIGESSQNGNGHNQDNGSSNVAPRINGFVNTTIAKPYVNVPIAPEDNSKNQLLNHRLSCGVTDSHGETDNLRLPSRDYSSQKCCSGNQTKVINDSLLCTTIPLELRNQRETENCLVQQTYHFPRGLKGFTQSGNSAEMALSGNHQTIDSEDESEVSTCTENNNYGHFVPFSQITQHEKEKQLWMVQENLVSVI